MKKPAHCKNCGKPLHDLYCSHCGQKASIGRITFSYLWQELIYFFLHIDKGFFYTTWQMLAAPGITVKNFIDGKRKTYQSPVSYFLIWITLYLLLLYFVARIFGDNAVINYKEYFGPSATTKFAISHLSIILAVIVPFQALYVYVLVLHRFYNYFESLAITIYSLGTVIVMQSVFVLIAIIFHLVFSLSLDLLLSDGFKVIYIAWYIGNLISLYPVKQKLIRSLAFIILAFGTFTAWRIYGVPVFTNWFLSE